MTGKRSVRWSKGLAAALLLAAVQTASAQSSCSLEEVGGTGRHKVTCAGGISIVAEAGASYALLDRTKTGSVNAVRLDGKAVLVEVPDGTAFEVVAPQAIAAVRGTQWAVDVAAGKTSVFVVTGSVAVKRPAEAAGVVLGPGEGVDVSDDGQPLAKRRWPQPRVAALLARLGQ